MSSMFFTQGTVLNLKLGEFVLPIASLHIFNGTRHPFFLNFLNFHSAIGILVLVPLFDRVLYPLLKKYQIEFGMLKRIGTGFCMACLGLIYAGRTWLFFFGVLIFQVLEVYRLYLFNQGHWFRQKVGNMGLVAVDLSILVQAPAYFLIASGEVLSSVTGTITPPNKSSNKQKKNLKKEQFF